MKTKFTNAQATRSRRGSSLLIVLMLLVFMVVLAAANTSSVNRLRQRVKLVEQRQTARLAAVSTNTLHAAQSATGQPKPNPQ